MTVESPLLLLLLLKLADDYRCAFELALMRLILMRLEEAQRSCWVADHRHFQ
jgi:hypothetical protein